MWLNGSVQIRYGRYGENHSNPGKRHADSATAGTAAYQSFRKLVYSYFTSGNSLGTAFVSVLTDAVRAIAAFFNVELPEIDYSGMDSIGTSAGVATDEIEDTTGALGDAAAAAKKLKDYTLGFDELNILNPDTGTASGGIGGSGGASGGSYGAIWICLLNPMIF